MIQIQEVREFMPAMLAGDFLQVLDPLYPDFSYWYTNTAVPGLITGNDVMLGAYAEGQLIGVALGKRSLEETKLRCVRVLPGFTGLGVRLIARMLDLLEDEKPHCTVAEELIHDYSRVLVNHFGFRLDHISKGRYRPHKLEYELNHR